MASPVDLRVLLQEHVDELADAVLERVRAGEGPHGAPDAATLRNLRLGARAAVDCFLARLAGERTAAEVDLFVAHGRAQQAAGRTLTELLSFYRLGGLAMWERSTALLPPSTQLPAHETFAFGSAVLELVDELSVAAAEGFTAGEAEARRRSRALRERLVSLLLSDRPAAPEALALAARAAGWTLPARVRVAVGALPADPLPTGAGPGPARVLAATVSDGREALVVADGEEAEQWLGRAATALGLEAPLAIGPAVAPADSARSAARAIALLDHVGAGAVGAAGDVVRCDDHEIALLLGAAPDLAREVAGRRLAPLSALDDAARERMVATLAAWLADPGRPQAMADRLGLHVQTIRYRLKALRELLGDALDDPDERFELSLALRVQSPAPPPAS
ncbi:MAG TPA: helix-turn-helix domain-containing protein [Baekduia sp.]|uniref:helix-turn-helix domain-containing protein n=1 Tax=Baekduia sp. TaxID=2600305 RepID=UPI002D07A38E|nr:helix-turn-helix domain-containing protein [Baekduia sp.]HMJ37468.1 helix-turn-helix domain-containing protein [Baekduia sp.]